MTKHLTIISLGAGVQSTAMLVMSARGMHGVGRADAAIFSDTGDEPAHVYRHLANCIEYGAEYGIPVHITSKGYSISSQMAKCAAGNATRFGSIPAYTPDPKGGREGMLRRQCTREYKIEPLEKKTRELLGLKMRQRAVGKVSATSMIGISTDEAIRAKPSRTRWITNVHPLLDANLSRADCISFLDEQWPYSERPGKSSCVFCPYHSDAAWQELKVRYPEDFARAVEVDRMMRTLTKAGVDRPAFVHRSCKPLDEVDFLNWKEIAGQASLFDNDGFGNECDGMCGV